MTAPLDGTTDRAARFAELNRERCPIRVSIAPLETIRKKPSVLRGLSAQRPSIAGDVGEPNTGRVGTGRNRGQGTSGAAGLPSSQLSHESSPGGPPPQQSLSTQLPAVPIANSRFGAIECSPTEWWFAERRQCPNRPPWSDGSAIRSLGTFKATHPPWQMSPNSNGTRVAGDDFWRFMAEWVAGTARDGPQAG